MPKMVTSRAGSLERRGLTDEQLVAMLRNMLLQRQIDNRGFQLNRQGKIPFALGSEGHEALQAGAAMAFARGKDVLAPYYRDLGLVLGIGLTPYEMFVSMFARAADASGGRQFPNHYTARERGLLSISSIIAAHCPHAVGVAYAFKLRRETGRAVLVTTTILRSRRRSARRWRSPTSPIKPPGTVFRVSFATAWTRSRRTRR